MKKFIWVFLLAIILLGGTSVYAVDLVSDPNPGCARFDLEVNGAVTESKLPAQSDGSVKYPVDDFSSGKYTFRARCYDATNDWPSSWSVPLVATKPANVGNLKIQ